MRSANIKGIAFDGFSVHQNLVQLETIIRNSGNRNRSTNYAAGDINRHSAMLSIGYLNIICMSIVHLQGVQLGI